jgi:hypothetical protein
MPVPATLANVVFAAPTYVYLMGVGMPIAVLAAMAAELFVFRSFQKKVSLGGLVSLVLGVNLFSWFAGLVLTFLLPDGFARVDGQSEIVLDTWPRIGAAFGFALVASIVLELAFVVLLKLWLRLPLERLPLCVTAANLASYAVLFLWVTLFQRL